MKVFTHDCIIIGGGPGGLIAATYLRRFHRRVLVIDRGAPRLLLAPRINNLVGYVRGISGKNLLTRLKQQAARFNTPTIHGDAAIYRRRGGFEVQVNDQNYFSKFVILALGFKDKHPPELNHTQLCRLGLISYCPICDGYDHSGQDIAVIVNSSSGFRKIKFLYTFSKRLHIVLIKDIKIPARHIEKINKLNVKVHRGFFKSAHHDLTKKRLIISLRNQRPFAVDAAYVSMGLQVPQSATKNLRGLRKTTEGRLLTDSHQQTSIKSLFAVGDCAHCLAQVSVAAGHAAIAATRIHHLLGGVDLDKK